MQFVNKNIRYSGKKISEWCWLTKSSIPETPASSFEISEQIQPSLSFWLWACWRMIICNQKQINILCFFSVVLLTSRWWTKLSEMWLISLLNWFTPVEMFPGFQKKKGNFCFKGGEGVQLTWLHPPEETPHLLLSGLGIDQQWIPMIGRL